MGKHQMNDSIRISKWMFAAMTIGLIVGCEPEAHKSVVEFETRNNSQSDIEIELCKDAQYSEGAVTHDIRVCKLTVGGQDKWKKYALADGVPIEAQEIDFSQTTSADDVVSTLKRQLKLEGVYYGNIRFNRPSSWGHRDQEREFESEIELFGDGGLAIDLTDYVGERLEGTVRDSGEVDFEDVPISATHTLTVEGELKDDLLELRGDVEGEETQFVIRAFKQLPMGPRTELPDWLREISDYDSGRVSYRVQTEAGMRSRSHEQSVRIRYLDSEWTTDDAGNAKNLRLFFNVAYSGDSRSSRNRWDKVGVAVWHFTMSIGQPRERPIFSDELDLRPDVTEEERRAHRMGLNVGESTEAMLVIPGHFIQRLERGGFREDDEDANFHFKIFNREGLSTERIDSWPLFRMSDF